MAAHAFRIYKTISRFGGALGVALAMAVPVLIAQPVAAQGASNGGNAKCFDALAGVATTCPASTSFAVDGKKPGQFQTGKCYTIADTTKGWVTSDCNGDNFKNVVPTQSTPNNVDNAAQGNCPTELDPQKQCDIVRQYLNPIINALGILVVIAVVISIVIGGIQYTTSADQPGAVSAARHRIMNAIIALLAFTFLWSFLQWVVPGGIF